jgi:hypothetical protein
MSTSTGNEQQSVNANGASENQDKPAAERDGKGRFAPGNQCGAGNPFARRVALLRTVVLTTVREEDMHAIVRKLIELAKNGDVAAARLVLGYSLGKPAETVDPDRLDIDEWQLNAQTSVPLGDLVGLMSTLPAYNACNLLDVAWPCAIKHDYAPLTEALKSGADKITWPKGFAAGSARGVGQGSNPAGAPSTNGGDGRSKGGRQKVKRRVS